MIVQWATERGERKNKEESKKRERIEKRKTREEKKTRSKHLGDINTFYHPRNQLFQIIGMYVGKSLKNNIMWIITSSLAFL